MHASKTAFSMPLLGLGTWRIGGDGSADYSHDNKEIQAIKTALKLGYSLIDTTEMYGAGHCEELIGKAIEGFDRKKLFIVSKVLDDNLHYEDVIKSAKASLKRLNTLYMDLYLIHAPNSEISLEETMQAMDYLMKEKLVKNIGVSNFTVDLLKEAQSFSKNPIVVNQIEYSLMTRNEGIYGYTSNQEKEIIPYCEKNHITVMSERPLERGLLLKSHPVMNALVEKYSKTRAQIALNWLITKGIVAIPKSTDKTHLKENLGALGWNLSKEDVQLLDKTKF